MKKSILKILVFASVLVCGMSAFAAPKKKISTTVESIDKHGNVNLAIKGNIFYVKGFGISDIVQVSLGKLNFSAPIGRNYSDVDEGSYIVRVNKDEVSVAINMGNIAEKAKADVGTPVTITMKEPRGYLITYQKRILNASDKREDFASDEIFANFREVKIGKIASGRLYRSSNPVNGLSRSPYALKLTEEVNPTLILNLAESPDIIPMIQEPYYKKMMGEGKVKFLNLGSSLSDDTVALQLHQGFAAMLESDGPYLIHGKEGKLRTGFTVAILGSLCGATMEEIDNDFMVSYENYNGIKKGSPQYEAIAKTLTKIFTKINDGKKITDKKLPSLAEKYLIEDVGLTKEEVDLLREKLTK